MNNKVLEFIKRRFSDNWNWDVDNCYYFALILKDRFPNGKIFYDTRYKTFIYKYGEKYYNWLGIYSCKEDYLVPWDLFEMYNPEQKKIIMQDYIM